MDRSEGQLKELVGAGLFGPGRFSYMKINPNNEHQTYPDIAFCDVGIEHGAVSKTYQLTLKTQQRQEAVRKIMNADKLYCNEVAMYKVVLPFLKADDLIPHYYYGRATLGADVKKDVLVLEDARTSGFTKSKTQFLDYQEIVVALKNLGKFHGLSYKAKNHYGQIFSCMTATLQGVIPGDEHWDAALKSALERGIRPLMGKTEDRSLLQQVLNRIHEPRKAMKNLRSPKEPFAVIYHGDFQKENILYKYNERGTPVDCVFVDFQMSLYSDPSIDIVYLLYMNTTAELREKHWDEFLKVYWKSVISIEPNPGFNYDQFLDNLSRRAVYGYFPSSIFLTRALSNDPKGDSTEQLNKLGVEERVRRVSNMGGAEGTNVLTKIVKHLLDRGYLDKYVHSEF